MSGLLDKAKNAVKGGSSSGGNAGAGGQQSGIEKGISGVGHTRTSIICYQLKHNH